MDTMIETISPELKVLRLSGGVLDAVAASALRERCLVIAGEGAEAMVIDLQAPGELSDSGLATMVDLVARPPQDVRVVLCNPGEAMEHRLRQLGLDRAIGCQPSVGSALMLPSLRRQLLTGHRAILLATRSERSGQRLSQAVPFAMLDLAGRPVLDHLLRHMGSYGLVHATIETDPLRAPFLQAFGPGGSSATRVRLHVWNPNLGETEPQAALWLRDVSSSIARVDEVGALRRLCRWQWDQVPEVFVIRDSVVTDINFWDLLLHHRRSQADVTIAHNDAKVEGYRRQGDRSEGECGASIAAEAVPRGWGLGAGIGVFVFSTGALEELSRCSDGAMDETAVADLAKRGARISIYRRGFRGLLVNDPPTHYTAVASLLTGRLPYLPPVGSERIGGAWVAPGADLSAAAEIRGSCFLGPGARVGAKARLEGVCSVGSASSIQGPCVLRDTMVWPGSVVRSGTWASHANIGPDWMFDRRFGTRTALDETGSMPETAAVAQELAHADQIRRVS